MKTRLRLNCIMVCLLPVRLSDDILITRISDQNRTSFRAALRLVRRP